MSAHSRVSDLIEIMLSIVAQEAGTTQDQLSVEVESVITRGVLEAFKRGTEYAHERPTDHPPNSLTPPKGILLPKNPTPQPWSSRITVPVPPVNPPRPKLPTPQPRRKRRDNRED